MITKFDILIPEFGALWPGRFNDSQIAMLLKALPNATIDDLGQGMADVFENVPNPSAVDFVRYTNIRTSSRLLKEKCEIEKKIRENACIKCDSTGMVTANDFEGNSFSFRCLSCDVAVQKGLSLSIPFWEDKYTKQGFTPYLFKRSTKKVDPEKVRNLFEEIGITMRA